MIFFSKLSFVVRSPTAFGPPLANDALYLSIVSITVSTALTSGPAASLYRLGFASMVF
ncbi:exported hypothetical protein [Agrobacterium fabacearum S56]|nr:exported hypothetical protein [Agrobacterium fabacearum S56]